MQIVIIGLLAYLVGLVTGYMFDDINKSRKL